MLNKNTNAVVRKTDGNPEGKGVSGLMLDWQQSEPRGIVAKPRHQILAEFFTSMLILSANFKFRPVVGRPTYLYWTNAEWSLSFISPDEWSTSRQAGFVGTCILQHDMTWTMTPSEQLGENNDVSEAVGRFYDAFAEIMDTDLPLEEVLPSYVSGMPYYHRIYASALSRSLKATTSLSGLSATSCRQWQPLLASAVRLLDR